MNVFSFGRTGSVLLALALLCAPIQAYAQDKTAAGTRQYNAAVGLHNTGAYDLAAKEWVKFITDFKTDPRVCRAWHYLGVCYSKLKKPTEAEKAFATVVKSFPNCDVLEETLLNLGLTQYNMALSGKPETFDAAAATFNMLATKYPKGKHLADAIFYEGECLYNRGKKKEAAAKYSQVVTNHPNHVRAAQALFALGVTWADLGQHKEAIATCGWFLKKFPQSPLVAEATMWQGESQYALGQYAEAIKSYTAAAGNKAFKMADYATVRLADALAALKKYAEAAAMYASVPGKYPKSKYIGLCKLEAGKKYYAAGEFAKALEFLNEVIAGGGKSAPEAAHWAARSLLKQNKPAEALELVGKVLPGAGAGPDAATLLMDQADATYEIPAQRGESVALYAALAAQYPGTPEAPQALYLAAFAAMNLDNHKTALSHANAFLTAHGNHELATGAMHVKAESSLLLNRYAEAEKLYRQLLQRAPGDRDAEIWKVHLGTALYLQKKYTETIAALSPVITGIKTPDLLAEGWYRLGSSQAALKQFPEAVKSLERALAIQPKWKLADDNHLVLAYAYQQTKDYAKAKEHARKVIAEFPDSKLLDVAHYRLAESCRLSNDLKTAVAEYKLLLKNWPDSRAMRQAVYGLGWAQVGLKDYAGAETSFSTLIEKYPDYADDAYFELGWVQKSLKKQAKAAASFAKLVEKYPNSTLAADAHYLLGDHAYEKKDYKKAALAYHAAMTKAGKTKLGEEATYKLGLCYYLLDDLKNARQTFNHQQLTWPGGSLVCDAAFWEAESAFRQKDYKQALPVYEKVEKPSSQQIAVLTLLHGAQAAGQLEKWEQCLALAGKCVEQFPDSPQLAQAMYEQGRAEQNLGKLNQAMATYAKVITKSNAEPAAAAQFMIGEIQFGQKKYAEAIASFFRVIGGYGYPRWQADASYEAGRCFEVLGKKPQAVKQYQRLVEKFPKSDKVPLAKERIEALK